MRSGLFYDYPNPMHMSDLPGEKGVWVHRIIHGFVHVPGPACGCCPMRFSAEEMENGPSVEKITELNRRH